MLRRSEPRHDFGVDESPIASPRSPMKVIIHISHSDSDDLCAIQAAAAALGFEVTPRGAFMGRSHTEMARDLTSDALETMLETLGGGSAIAA
jgi:hypothetical protein